MKTDIQRKILIALLLPERAYPPLKGDRPAVIGSLEIEGYVAIRLHIVQQKHQIFDAVADMIGPVDPVHLAIRHRQQRAENAVLQKIEPR